MPYRFLCMCGVWRVTKKAQLHCGLRASHVWVVMGGSRGFGFGTSKGSDAVDSGRWQGSWQGFGIRTNRANKASFDPQLAISILRLSRTHAGAVAVANSRISAVPIAAPNYDWLIFVISLDRAKRSSKKSQRA